MPLSAIRSVWLGLVALLVLLWPVAAQADNAEVAKPGLRVESIETALTAYEQNGFGYQSKAGPELGKGSQRVTVFEPQVLVMLRQSPRITHRLWMPVDLVTAASPNATDRGRAPDMLSQASRQNQSVTVDWNATYEVPRAYSVSARNIVHVEENFRSWGTGLAGSMSLADDNATVSLNAIQFYDWFSRYGDLGRRIGRTNRSTTSGSAGFTQILSPTTIVHANYGLSAQYGEMSNTWNTVITDANVRVIEHEPRHRIRHALVGRFAQFLPWNGTVKGLYRFYGDDWGMIAHTAEGQLLQRLSPRLFVRGSYRFYTQTSASFFSTLVRSGETFFTSDSDLGRFDSHTVGGKASAEIPEIFRGGHLDVGYERYWRTDGLKVNIVLCQAGARF